MVVHPRDRRGAHPRHPGYCVTVQPLGKHNSSGLERSGNPPRWIQTTGLQSLHNIALLLLISTSTLRRFSRAMQRSPPPAFAIWQAKQYTSPSGLSSLVRLLMASKSTPYICNPFPAAWHLLRTSSQVCMSGCPAPGTHWMTSIFLIDRMSSRC